MWHEEKDVVGLILVQTTYPLKPPSSNNTGKMPVMKTAMDI
jgi:hypothetical protein